MKIESMSQFFNAIMDKNHAIHTDASKRTITNFGTGFFPPDKVADRILRIAKEGSIVRSRALVLPADPVGPDVPMSIPVLKQGEDGISGRMQMSWFGEGDMPVTDSELGEVRYEPHEIGGIINTSDKLMRNVSSENYFDGIIADSIVESEDDAFLAGNGINKPLGVLNCPGTIDVRRGDNNTVRYEDLINMISKLPPSSIKKAIWVANQSALRDMLAIRDVGDSNLYRDGKLLGIPLEFTEFTPVLGQRGDLMLCDFRYYVIKDGTGLRIAISNVAGYGQNKSQLRAIKNVDGHGIVASPLRLKNGNLVSPFVVLK